MTEAQLEPIDEMTLKSATNATLMYFWLAVTW